MEHHELVQEMGSIERMTTQERLKHARKRRSQQLKKWNHYEKQLDKEHSKKKKNRPEKHIQSSSLNKSNKKRNKGNIRFAPNIVLLEVAARNDINEVRRLLESGVDPDVTNEDGLTALHQCCIDDSEEMMKLLLDHNANVNACDSEMWTPLHAAAVCGHLNLCRHLIDRGAELLAVNTDGNMPYDICEDDLTLDYIESEMSKRGITQEQIDATRLATEHQMLADLKDYASKGGDLEFTDQNGATMLHIAAANGYVEVAEFLLDNHVLVDIRDNDSWQPIHAAAYWSQQEIMELLVESGADLDSKTKSGLTPFDLCDEPDLKQKILDMKDEIETKRVIRQQRPGSQRKPRVSSRNASIRRSSMRGDKSQLFRKEHKEEALHFGLNLMKDTDSLKESDEEEHDHQPARELDEVTITVGDDFKHPGRGGGREEGPAMDTYSIPTPTSSAKVTTIQVNKPTPKPRSSVSPTSSSDSTDAHHQPPVPHNAGRDARLGPASHQTKPQPLHPPASSLQGPGPTLAGLKEKRGQSRGPGGDSAITDRAVETIFLNQVQGGRTAEDGQANYPNPPAPKTKNGHNNNNSRSAALSSSGRQLQRFVAPEHALVVGEDDSKKGCCVIL